MEIKESPPGTLQLIGEATIYTAAELKLGLLTQLSRHDQLVVDLSEVSEIDSAGMQLLILLKREANEKGKVLKLSGHSSATKELFELYDITALFGNFSDSSHPADGSATS